MTISEKELYNFVFYPDKLSSHIFEYINNNKEKFQEQILLLNDLKQAANENLHDKDIVSEIYNRIAELEELKNIELSLVSVDNSGNIKNLPELDSWDLEKNVQVKSFSDKHSRFLAKVVSSDTQTSILIINNDFSEIRDVEITIYPTEEIFLISNSSEPLILKPKREIKKLLLNLVSYQ